jgi:hypothetical protein
MLAAKSGLRTSERVKKLAVMLSEASAFVSLKTNKIRFLAALGMTGLVDFFTPSLPWGEGLIFAGAFSERRKGWR